jgi:transposase
MLRGLLMARAAKKAKAKKERPSNQVYREEYHPDLAYKLCLLGHTNAELATVFEVSEKSIENWIEKYPEFAEEVFKGRDIADAEIALSLHQRAKGYKHRAVKIMQNNGVVIQQAYTEHYPPDTQAAALWLTNRRGKKWKNKQSNEVGGPDGEPLTVNLVRRVIIDPKQA